MNAWLDRAGGVVTLGRTEWRLPYDGEPLAQYVRAARKDRSFTLDELVRRTGLPTATIRKIEGGATRNPGLFTLLPIWHALGLPVVAFGRVARSPAISKGGTR